LSGSLHALNTLSKTLWLKKRLKKSLSESIILIPGHVALDKVDIWFQDEARFGQQNTTTRVWAEKGSRPRVEYGNDAKTSSANF